MPLFLSSKSLTASSLESTTRVLVPRIRLYTGPYSRAHFSNWRWASREGICIHFCQHLDVEIMAGTPHLMYVTNQRESWGSRWVVFGSFPHRKKACEDDNDAYCNEQQGVRSQHLVCSIKQKQRQKWAVQILVSSEPKNTYRARRSLPDIGVRRYLIYSERMDNFFPVVSSVS